MPSHPVADRLTADFGEPGVLVDFDEALSLDKSAAALDAETERIGRESERLRAHLAPDEQDNPDWQAALEVEVWDHRGRLFDEESDRLANAAMRRWETVARVADVRLRQPARRPLVRLRLLSTRPRTRRTRRATSRAGPARLADEPDPPPRLADRREDACPRRAA
jgi:hypothetical protein